MGRGNNYGLETRDMLKAGRFALNRAATAGHVGYQTAGDVGVRWQQFATFCQHNGLRRLEEIDREIVLTYGREIGDRVAEGGLSPSTGQNLVSAVNTVLKHATQGEWRSVGAVKDCGIGRRSTVREIAPDLNRQPVTAAAADLRAAGNARGAAVLELARDLGLRTREASLLDANHAADQARALGSITISDGTKGGRDRLVPITPNQLATLGRAAQTQGDERAVMPGDCNWVQWGNGGLRNARETLQDHGIKRIHDLRSAYAAERYEQITGERIPLNDGHADRDTDRRARLQIALELGHNRIDITASYIGGRSR